MHMQALHQMKVAVGSENPYITERLDHTFDAARNALAGSVSSTASGHC